MVRRRCTRAGDREYQTSLPSEALKRIRREALERRVPQKEIVKAAIEEYFHPKRKELFEEALNSKLARIERQLVSLEQTLTALFIYQEHFVKEWYRAAELPGTDRQAAKLKVKKRYRSFFTRFARALSREGPKERALCSLSESLNGHQ